MTTKRTTSASRATVRSTRAPKKTSAPKKRGPKGPRDWPVNPQRIHKIVRMRDVKDMTFYAIAQELSKECSITEQAVNIAYRKWRDWAIKNPK